MGLEEIKMKEEKIKKVLDQPTSKEVKNIQKFLGLVNYYWQFITAIARLLHNLVKKNQKWDWIERQKGIFRELKERFIKELVVAVLDLD